MNNVKIPVPLKPSNNKEYINPALVLLAVFDLANIIKNKLNEITLVRHIFF